MPPKKKAKTNEDNNQPAPKVIDKSQALTDPKKESFKIQEKPASIPTLQPISKPVVSQPAQKLQEQPPTQQKTEIKQQKIVLSDPLNLSEEQKLRLRQLKFNGVVGAIVSTEESERIRQQRMKKFGAVDQKEIIQKRKQKFGNIGSVVANDDLNTLKKRLQKFNNIVQTESKDVLEERKKKFAVNAQANVSLDDEIKKTKQIHKHEKHKPNFHHKGKFNKFRR